MAERSMKGSYALVRNTLGSQEVILDRLNRETVKLMLQGPMFHSMGTSTHYEAFNNETGDVDYDGGWDLFGRWRFRDWTHGECRVCETAIHSAELCFGCAVGNDPFVTSKYKEVRDAR